MTTDQRDDPTSLERAGELFRADYARVRAEVAREVVGQDQVVDAVLTAMFSGGHVLLEGVPGIGKTLLVRALSRALSLSSSRVQFTPDLMPADVTGTSIVQDDGSGGPRRFVFRPGPLFASLVLADEINRATPKTQSALLEAMQERSVTVGTQTHALPEPFFVMATQNPIEQEGTYPLPEAQLDRFFFKVLVRMPDRAAMHEILDRTTGAAASTAGAVLDAQGVLAHMRVVRRVAVARHVQDYAVRLVLATHPDSPGAAEIVKSYVRLGASPRAAQTLILAAKCVALRDGRWAASTDDIRSVAAPALRHRLIMNFESHAEGVTPESVVERLTATLPLEAPA